MLEYTNISKKKKEDEDDAFEYGENWGTQRYL